MKSSKEVCMYIYIVMGRVFGSYLNGFHGPASEKAEAKDPSLRLFKDNPERAMGQARNRQQYILY